jgi:hypothetical protein
LSAAARTLSTIPAPLQRSSWLRAKYILFGFVGVMLLYGLRHNESFLIHPQDPVWQHYQPFKWWLLPHGIAGACALLLGPMQFSERLRPRFTKLHRIVGRIYVAGVFVAGLLGLYIQFLSGAHGTAKIVQPCRRRRCGVVDDDDGQRLRIYPGGKSAAASILAAEIALQWEKRCGGRGL